MMKMPAVPMTLNYMKWNMKVSSEASDLVSYIFHEGEKREHTEGAESWRHIRQWDLPRSYSAVWIPTGLLGYKTREL